VPALLYVLINGWMTSSIGLPDGARQILRIHLPGDIIGVPSIGVVEALDTLQAVTDVEFSTFDRMSLKPIFSDHPRVAALFFLISQHERIHLSDRLLHMGCTSAQTRLCAMILQMRDRLRRVTPTLGSEIPVWLTQADIGDYLGLTTVHVNRTLKALTESGIISRRHHWLKIEDEEAMAALAQLPTRTFDYGREWLPDTPKR
jgi:CRP/FNR family transcriptional regulator, anaerobic regulatory protein